MTEPSDRPAPTFGLGEWREIATGVYVAVAEPESVNLGLVVGRDSALLVDCGSSPDQGLQIRESLATVTDRPLSAVVLTHWHYDHAFGLAAFADVLTVAHDTVRTRLLSPAAAREAGWLGVTGPLGLPNREIAVATAIDLGDRRVEIAHLGTGHTDGDLVVVVPDADLLFTGDLVESAGPPSLGPESVAGDWAVTLDGIVGLMTAHTRAVPGHGEPVDREFVFEQRGRMAGVAAGFPAGLDEGPAERSTLPLV